MCGMCGMFYRSYACGRADGRAGARTHTCMEVAKTFRNIPQRSPMLE